MLNDYLAMTIAVLIIAIGLFYYYFILPKINKAGKGITPQILPSPRVESIHEKKCDIIVPISNPDTVKNLISMAISITDPHNGKILPIHVINVPEVIAIESKYDDLKENMINYEEIINNINYYQNSETHIEEPVLVLSRNTSDSILNSSIESSANLILLGWHRSGIAQRMLGGLISDILKKSKSSVAIYKPSKKKTERKIEKILLPYGGGFHSQSALAIAKKIFENTNACITLLRVVEEDCSVEEIKQIEKIINEGMKNLNIKYNLYIEINNNISKTIINKSNEYDLIVMGMSDEWGLANYVTGSMTDHIMEQISIHGLIIREYNPILSRTYFRSAIQKIKHLTK